MNAIGPAPREKENISFLKVKGIKGVLSLCSEDEVKLPIELRITLFGIDFSCQIINIMIYLLLKILKKL